MKTTIEAERVRDNQDTPSGQRVIGFWFDLTEAAGMLGVSDRTIRRRIKAGEIPNRMHKGRRQVRIDTADMTDGQPADNQDSGQGGAGSIVRDDKVSGSVGDALANINSIERQLAGVLATMSDELKAERQLAVERVEVELERVRRRSGLGWALAFVLAAVSAAGAFLLVQVSNEARIEAAALRSDLRASEGQASALADQLGSSEARVDQAVSALSDMTGQIQSAQVRTLEAQLQQAQAEAERNRAPGIMKP